MSIDRDETTGARCPSCGARNSADAVWCSLCFGAMSGSSPRAADVDPREVDVEELAGIEEQVASQPRVDALLAELAAVERPAPRWSGASALVASPGARVAVMLLGTVLITGVGFALMAALGALL